MVDCRIKAELTLSPILISWPQGAGLINDAIVD
jgi:hypothetical protein